MKEMHTIFNHALAPITPGPSSSNTCGPVRIGLVSNQLFGKIPAKVIIEYDEKGAFPSTLYGMKSDIAFINGILGKEQNAADFIEAYECARKANLVISFNEVNDLKVGGMETARIKMFDESGFEMTVIGESVGGGAFLIHEIDGCKVDTRGMDYELFVFLKPEKANITDLLIEKISPFVKIINGKKVINGNKYTILNIKSANDFGDDILKVLDSENDIEMYRIVRPVHPITNDVSRQPVFDTPDEFIAYCDEKKCSPGDAAIEYEVSVSGWDESEVRKYADNLLSIMKESRTRGFDPGLSFEGIVTPKASLLKTEMESKKMPSLGILDRAIPTALGIMEHSNASGKIVCVPTGGSSGIVPGLLLSAAEQLNASDDEIYKALMCAGIIGVLMMVDGNEFAGGTHGCQAEIACGTAMAAAGLVQLMGGTAKQACDSASMCLQCFLGLICDPVAGLVQVPCLARNIAGVSVAAASAESVFAGFDVVIPLEEMSRIMIRVGNDVTKELGMCCSGCCLTPTGMRLIKEHDEACKKKCK